MSSKEFNRIVDVHNCEPDEFGHLTEIGSEGEDASDFESEQDPEENRIRALKLKHLYASNGNAAPLWASEYAEMT